MSKEGGDTPLREKEEDTLQASKIWPLALADLQVHRVARSPYFHLCPAYVHFEALSPRQCDIARLNKCQVSRKVIGRKQMLSMTHLTWHDSNPQEFLSRGSKYF